jgi:hypothetical protein
MNLHKVDVFTPAYKADTNINGIKWMKMVIIKIEKAMEAEYNVPELSKVKTKNWPLFKWICGYLSVYLNNMVLITKCDDTLFHNTERQRQPC